MFYLNNGHGTPNIDYEKWKLKSKEEGQGLPPEGKESSSLPPLVKHIYVPCPLCRLQLVNCLWRNSLWEWRVDLHRDIRKRWLSEIERPSPNSLPVKCRNFYHLKVTSFIHIIEMVATQQKVPWCGYWPPPTQVHVLVLLLKRILKYWNISLIFQWPLLLKLIFLSLSETSPVRNTHTHTHPTNTSFHCLIVATHSFSLTLEDRAHGICPTGVRSLIRETNQA